MSGHSIQIPQFINIFSEKIWDKDLRLINQEFNQHVIDEIII